MSGWEEWDQADHESDYPNNGFLAPQSGSRQRPLSTRSAKSRDGLENFRPRRPSLHRDYHSDNEATIGERVEFYDDEDIVETKEPRKSRKSRKKFLQPSHEDQGPPPPQNHPFAPDPQYWPPSIKQVPPPPAPLPVSLQRIPSPPPVVWHPNQQAPFPSTDVWGPVNPGGFEPADRLYHNVEVDNSSNRRLDWARQEQDRLAASHAQSGHEINIDIGRRKSGTRRYRSDPRRPSPPLVTIYDRAPIAEEINIDISHPRVPSPPQLYRRSPSPRKEQPRRKKTSGNSHFKQTPSPPPIARHGSAERVVQPPRWPVPPPNYQSTDKNYVPPVRTPSTGKRNPRNSTGPDLNASFSIPGAFPSVSGAVLPEDSRSEASPSRQCWQPTVANRSTRSLSSASGILGDKVYQYEELGDFHIRLIEIKPARMTMIKCNLHSFPLDEAPSYRAISYAWGDAGDTRKIMLEGTTISIAVSLYGALEALREKKDSVLVWADFLCIDQQNRDEKAQQLQMMTSIYSKAESVAIWLGPEADQSKLAVGFLNAIATNADRPEYIKSILKSLVGNQEISATVSLFERDYWKRLWVVQEVFNAKDIWVYCGSILHWTVFKTASHVFWRHKNDLDHYFPAASSQQNGQRPSPNQFTVSQALVYQGPGSLPDLTSLTGLREESLLHVMRALRRKISSDPRDKVFGILGVLPEDVRSEFPVDLSLSVREVYINVVDYLLSTTDRLDVICEAIHFPLHNDSANLPTWVPDWSHSPETTAMGNRFNFTASGETDVEYQFVDERRNKLEISAIYVDTISTHGIAVGTLCTLADYLMAFLHWRALLLGSEAIVDHDHMEDLEDDFCRTLCLNQVPPGDHWDGSGWRIACYHVFASLLRERLPRLKLDRDLEQYEDADVDIKPEERRGFLQKHFGSRMMGRCFFLTEKRMGMGSAFMTAGDLIVVPLGCSTPIILRPEGSRGEYRYVGDVFLDGYMYGEAVKDWKSGHRALQKYVLH